MSHSLVHAAGPDHSASMAREAERQRVAEAASRGRQTHPLPLRANFAWALAGNIVYLASQWAVLSVIAKLGNPEMVGQFALALAITAPVIMFSNMNLAVVQATDAGRQYRFADYLTLRVLTSGLGAVSIVGIVVAAGYKAETALVILAVGTAKVIESISDVLSGLFQQRQRMDSLARSMLMKGPLSVLAMSVGLYVTHSVVWGAVGLAAVWGLLLVAYEGRVARRLLGSWTDMRLGWTPARLQALARLAWPMGVVSLVNALVPNVPRYVIAHERGEAALGFYAAMAYLIVAGQSGMNALASSATPQLALYYAQRNRAEFKHLALRTMAVGAGAGLLSVTIAAVAGQTLLAILYTREYPAYADVLVYLTIGGCFSYMATFLWNAVTAARYFKAQVPVSAMAIVVAIAMNAALVPEFGLTGAAIASLITTVVQLAASAVLFRESLRTCASADDDHAAGSRFARLRRDDSEVPRWREAGRADGSNISDVRLHRESG